MKPKVFVYPDLEALSRVAAEEMVKVAQAAIEHRGRFSLVLSGGSTPRPLYRLLAKEQDRIRWDRVDLFWGDERHVSPDDPRSNYRMARETLLDHVPIPAENIHPMPTDRPDPDETARDYQALLKDHFPKDWPRFDLVLLGMGADGHIASLFPGSSALDEKDRWVLAVRAPVEPPRRLTLTLPVFNHSSLIFVLVAGKVKAGALHRALAGPRDPKTSPAVGVQPAEGSVIWWTDEAAATFLGPAIRSPSTPV